MDGPSSSWSLEIKPEWEQIENVREESARFLKERGMSEDVINAVSMVTAELTQNAVAYGSYERPEQNKIAISVAVGRDAITVEVKSPTTENDDNQDLKK